MIRIRPELKGALFALLAVFFLVCTVWIALGCRLNIWTLRDYDVYFLVTRGVTIGHRLWHGRIQAGDDIENILSGSNPQEVSRFGPWTEATYIPGGPRPQGGLFFVGVSLVAENGKLVRATYYSSTESRVFFDAMSAGDEARYQKDFGDYVDQLQADHDTNREPAQAADSPSSPSRPSSSVEDVAVEDR